METIIRRLRGDESDNEIYETAGEIIKKGGLVAFPTETVYGLGGDALNAESSAKIYEAKGRPSDNPLIVHIDCMERLAPLISGSCEAAVRFGERFWPGPLTIIAPKSDIVPHSTTGGLDTVAIRMPSHEGARSFIRAAGGYIAAPSANLSGRPSPTRAEHVVEDLKGRIDMIIDGGDVEYGLESTIVDLTEEHPTVLRPGFITPEQLREVCVDVRLDPGLPAMPGKGMAGKSGFSEAAVTGEGLRPKAPGMKYRHYAPKGELVIVRGEREAVAERINALVAACLEKGESAGVIATAQNLGLYSCGVIKCAGDRDSEVSIARSLFSILREFDKEGVMHIYSEELDTVSLGGAIMNRLIKAAGGRVMDV